MPSTLQAVQAIYMLLLCRHQWGQTQARGEIAIFLQVAVLLFVLTPLSKTIGVWILQQKEMMNHSHMEEREISCLSPVEIPCRNIRALTGTFDDTNARTPKLYDTKAGLMICQEPVGDI